jgi:hypothetical protein
MAYRYVLDFNLTDLDTERTLIERVEAGKAASLFDAYNQGASRAAELTPKIPPSDGSHRAYYSYTVARAV